MNKIILIIIIFPLFALSQQETKILNDLEFLKDSSNTQLSENKNITITLDTKLEQLITNFATVNKSKPEKIWRIQLYFGSGPQGKRKAISIKRKFQTKYPDIPVFIVFEEPYFKVRVGRCSSRLEADRLKYSLSKDYENLLIVEDTEK